jgi:hypothetical protein
MFPINRTQSAKRAARIAGVLYLVNAVTGFFASSMFPADSSYLVTLLQPPSTSSLPRGFSASASSLN